MQLNMLCKKKKKACAETRRLSSTAALAALAVAAHLTSNVGSGLVQFGQETRKEKNISHANQIRVFTQTITLRLMKVTFVKFCTGMREMIRDTHVHTE